MVRPTLRTPFLLLALLVVVPGCSGGGAAEEGPDLSVGVTVSERIVYYDSLGEPGAVESIALLERCIGRDHVEVQITAVEALGRIGSAEILPALERAAGDELPAMRVSVVLAASQVPPPASLPLLHRLLDDPSLRVRRAAANALIRVPDPSNVGPLMAIGRKTSDETVRRAAVVGLGKIGAAAADALPFLIDVSMMEDEKIRFDAVTAIQSIGTERAVEALRAHVRSDLPEIRGRACLSLANLVGPDVLDEILDALLEERNDVAAAAMARGAALLGERDISFATLERILLRGDPWASRAEAARALGESGDLEHLPLLMEAQHDPKGLVKKSAGDAIASIRSRHAAS